MKALTPAQRRQFETDGYLVLEDVLPEAVLAAVRAEYAALMDRLHDGWVAEGVLPPAGALDFWGKLRVAYEAGCDWFQPMDISLPGDEIAADTPFHFGPAVFDMLRHSRVLDIVEDLIGPEITSNPIQHVRIKPPAACLREGEARAHITATDWHQDRAVAHPEADASDTVTVWLAITDATVENGCLQVIPGMPAMHDHCARRQVSIPTGALDLDRARPVPVAAGGCVLLHPLTPHASLANVTDGFRWSFDLRYTVTGQPTGRDHFPAFVVRSRADPGAVLTGWRDWRDLWVAARARLAARDHIPIHRWPAEGPACA